MYLAIDQYGNHVHIRKHPRKELLEHCCRKHASRMYRDDPLTGKTFHVGYVIARRWFSIYKEVANPA